MALSNDSKMLGFQQVVQGPAAMGEIKAVDTGTTRLPLRNIMRSQEMTDANGNSLGLVVEMVFPTETGTLNGANMTSWGLDQFAPGSIFRFPAKPTTPLVIKTGAKGSGGYVPIAGGTAF